MITGTYFLNLIFGIILSRHHEVGGPPNGPILVDCLHFIPREVLFFVLRLSNKIYFIREITRRQNVSKKT